MTELRDTDNFRGDDFSAAFQVDELQHSCGTEELVIGQISMANGCDQPCPRCTSYYTCIVPGPHDGPHQCNNGHVW